MFILDTMLVGGLRFVFDKIAAAVDTELNDDTALREQNGHVNPRENHTTTLARPRYAARSTVSPCTELRLKSGAGWPTAGGSGTDATMRG